MKRKKGHDPLIGELGFGWGGGGGGVDVGLELVSGGGDWEGVTRREAPHADNNVIMPHYVINLYTNCVTIFCYCI